MKAALTIFNILLPVLIFSQSLKPLILKDNMLWIGYYNAIHLNQKWSVNSDIQFRTKNWYNDYSQALIRSGLAFSINDKITVTAGIAHFRYFITNEKTRGEWRPWQEIAVHDKLTTIKITHRFRLEERFSEQVKSNEPTNEYIFNYRFRYKLDLRFRLIKLNENGKNLVALVGNELMINAGKNITYNYFDQNRAYVGVNLELNKKLTLQLQYMHIWQQLSSGNTFLRTEVIRFNFYHTLQL
ncbi:MAG: DUF2490 domain-containing protein [Bacteroidetes bacterium]|nr:DUF2490 domain-containing protein [Bacteroidota bacterium]